MTSRYIGWSQAEPTHAPMHPDGRRWKAADIPDAVMLAVVQRAELAEGRWMFTDELINTLAAYPHRVVMAKAARLIQRKLLDGCTCGCRGDFVVTETGAAALDAATSVVLPPYVRSEHAPPRP